MIRSVFCFFEWNGIYFCVLGFFGYETIRFDLKVSFFFFFEMNEMLRSWHLCSHGSSFSPQFYGLENWLCFYGLMMKFGCIGFLA